MMQLGDIQFGISTAAYQNLTRTAEFKWASIDRFGQRPAVQFTGIGDESIEFDGVFYPEFAGGVDQIATWRATAALGTPLTMIDGRGTIWGDWAIENVQEKQSTFAIAGVARKQEFSMKLKFYDDSDVSESDISAAMAVTGVTVLPSAVTASNVANGAASSMAGIGSAINSAVAGIHAIASMVSVSVQPAIDAATQAMTIASTVQNSALRAQRLIKTAGNINSLASAQNALGGLLATANNAANSGAGVARLLNGIANDFSATQPAAATRAVRVALVGANQMTVSATNISKQINSIFNALT
jgi:phage protein U